MRSSIAPLDLFAPPLETPDDWGEGFGSSKKSRQLLIPYAIRAGRLVHVSEVESGLHADCLCSSCGEGLVAKKGERVAHHFAHRSESACSGETILHRTSKLMLAERLEKCIREGTELKISWHCSKCQSGHVGNLAKIAESVEVEKSLGAARPDILLRDRQGNPRVAVEIVVTHPPDHKAVDFYRANGIMLAVVVSRTLDHLELLRSPEAIFVSGVEACTRKKCPHCHAPLWWRLLLVRSRQCHICRSDIFAGSVILNRTTSICGYSADHCAKLPVMPFDRRLVASHGIRLSWTSEDSSRVCRNCRNSLADVYFRRYKYIPIKKIIPAGMYCDDCDTFFPDVRPETDAGIRQPRAQPQR